MTDLVVDASAYVFATTEATPRSAACRRRLVDTSGHAPHLLDAEVGSALRRKVRSGSLGLAVAEAALANAPALVEHRHAHAGALVTMAWGLRDDVSFYDALYVALAASLDAPLLTADRRLARSHGLPCAVDLVV
jgi:predicted nucleic acid-binding protein